MQRSMKKNAILTTIKTMLSLILPLVTFPYVSRVLQVTAIGKFNFASSIVNYFILIAGIGIETYAIREGAKIREDRERISEFASEMLAINTISTIFAYVLLALMVLGVKKLQDYGLLISILSIQVLLTTYGRGWIYNNFEDFSYITIVQIVFQFASFVLLFVMVKSPEDLYKYALINVISSTGSCILCGLHTRKYVDIKLVKPSSLKRHIRPILVIFSTSIATTIYVNSDMTILGWLVNDECVGLYSISVKIYNIIKQVLVAVITVTVPRLTLYAGSEKFKPMFSKIFNILFMFTLPTTVGLFMMSYNAIEIIAGNEYIGAVTSLRWLSIALVFALIACLFGIGVLLPYMKEKIFLKSTVISAIVNIVLNFILIPIFKQSAAAFTTVVSQGVALVICYKYSNKYVDLSDSKKSLFSVIIGCIFISIICLFIKSLELALYLETVLCIGFSILGYASTQLVFKNQYFFLVIESTMSFGMKKLHINTK